MGVKKQLQPSMRIVYLYAKLAFTACLGQMERLPTACGHRHLGNPLGPLPGSSYERKEEKREERKDNLSGHVFRVT